MKMLARQRREMQMKSSSSSSSDEDNNEAPVRPKRQIKKKTSPQKKGMTFALTSGVFAAFAGSFGKLAMNQTETILLCEQISNSHLNFSTQESYLMCDKVYLYY